MFRFRDRYQAGQFLAEHLYEYADRSEVIVLALPRGGLPVGFEVARALHVPLDVFLVRKLGLPGHEELAMGAIATGGVRFMNEDVLLSTRVSQAIIEQVAAREQQELERRERLYRGERPPPNLKNATVILVDDGLATGASMHAAALAVRAQGARTAVVAVPVAAEQTCRTLASVVDRVICPFTPEPFSAVGMWYEDFAQIDEAEVRELLEREARAGSTS
jgi:putative phosphoribosyl transferase